MCVFVYVCVWVCLGWLQIFYVFLTFFLQCPTGTLVRPKFIFKSVFIVDFSLLVSTIL